MGDKLIQNHLDLIFMGKMVIHLSLIRSNFSNKILICNFAAEYIHWIMIFFAGFLSDPTVSQSTTTGVVVVYTLQCHCSTLLYNGSFLWYWQTTMFSSANHRRHWSVKSSAQTLLFGPIASSTPLQDLEIKHCLWLQYPGQTMVFQANQVLIYLQVLGIAVNSSQ